MNNFSNMWRMLQGQAKPPLGEQFWKDITGILPNPGPRIDMFATKQHHVVVIELPGLKNKDHVKLRIEGTVLHIKGEIPYPYSVERDELLISERFLGHFERRIELPRDVIPESIQAMFQNGLLVVKMKNRDTPEQSKAVDIVEVEGLLDEELGYG